MAQPARCAAAKVKFSPATLRKQSFRPPFPKGGRIPKGGALWPPSADGGTLHTSGVFGGLGAFTRERPPRPLPIPLSLSGKRPPRWGGGPAGARGGPSYLFTGSLRWFWRVFPPGVFRHPAGGVVWSRPDRRVTFLRGQESNQRNRRGPLPAPWTPGAVVRDLRPLLAFSIEPSSGLSAAWVHTRRPPPFGCCAAEGVGFEGWVFYGGWHLAEGTSQSPAATAPLKRGA